MNVTRLEGADLNINVNLLGVAAQTRMTAGLFGDSEQGKQVDAWWSKYLRSDIVAPVAAWLLHEDNPSTGVIDSTAGGHVSRIFLGETPRYTNLSLTIEEVRDNVARIESQDGGYRLPHIHTEYSEHLSADLSNRMVVDHLLHQLVASAHARERLTAGTHVAEVDRPAGHEQRGDLFRATLVDGSTRSTANA